MPRDTSTDDTVAERKTWSQRLLHEVRETALTIAVFVPFWLVFSTFVYELRSIPSESMVPALQVGDRVAVAKFAYGYDRNSVPFGIGRLIFGDDKDNPNERIFAHMPKRGDVIVFQHPHDSKVMIKRLIGLPGDTIQMKQGRLYLNDKLIDRKEVRQTTYVSSDGSHMIHTATEYQEQLPGEKKPHLIHEWDDVSGLDQTPIFRIPAGHVFMMGDNRDNSEDSRAPSGHPDLAAAFPDAWAMRPIPGGPMAIGYVPMDDLIGRAETVLFTLHVCRREPGTDCAAGRLWKGLE